MGDHGEYDLFYREDGNLRVELTFAGCGITCENTDTVIYDAVFYRTEEKRQKLMLGEIEPRYFSEIVLQIMRALGLSDQ